MKIREDTLSRKKGSCRGHEMGTDMSHLRDRKRPD